MLLLRCVCSLRPRVVQCRGQNARVLCSAAAAPFAPKAALLVIGNEVLTGKVEDKNTAFLGMQPRRRWAPLVPTATSHTSAQSPTTSPALLTPPSARLLYSRGVDLIRVEVTPDDPEDIARSVAALSERVGHRGFVFTSGGIGPTHDDVTYLSVAAAFGVQLELHAATVQKMRVHYAELGKELNASRLRMATLPAGCTVHEIPGSWVPLCQVRNVYVLPGIPWLFRQMLEASKQLFSGSELLSESLYTHSGEGELAAALTEVADKHPLVSIGSYPNTDRADKRYTTKLCFDGRDAQALQAAMSDTRSVIATFDECN